MSRYASMFKRLDSRREGALGCFLMLGDPDLETSAKLLDALVEGGADMLEVGIPFSDPIADGPVIQAAACRALASGTRVSDCFALLGAFRARHPEIPVGILTYANLVVARTIESFYAAAAKAGVDSVLVADVPALEAAPFALAASRAGIDPVLIAATNSGAEALKRIADITKGYTYCVSRSGVTGVRADLKLNHKMMLETLSQAGAPPAILGFGISTPEHVVQALEEGAAGVICGSAVVRLVEAAANDRFMAVRNFVASLKEATLAENRPAMAKAKIMEDGDVR